MEMNEEVEEKEEEKIGDDGEDEGDYGGGGLNLSSVEVVGVRHASALLEVAGGVPLDVARTILAAHYRTIRAAKASGRQRLTGGFIQCPTCSTPWIAALCKPRLLGCPRNPKAERGKLKQIIRLSQTNPGKLTSRDKSLLTRYQSRENVIEVSCLVCRHKKHEFFPVPERPRNEVEVEVTSGTTAKKRKKKRKRVKEVNAGLLLPSSTSSSSFSSTFKTSKIGRRERKEASPTVPIFTTSLEGHRNTLDTQANTHVKHKNTSTHPRLKPKRKVLLGSDAPGATLPHPASAATPGIARERKRTVENLKKVMSKEKAKSTVCNGRGKVKNSLSSFLDSLL